jgi:hypothetical protein
VPGEEGVLAGEEGRLEFVPRPMSRGADRVAIHAAAATRSPRNPASRKDWPLRRGFRSGAHRGGSAAGVGLRLSRYGAEVKERVLA